MSSYSEGWVPVGDPFRPISKRRDLRFPALLDCDLCRAFQRVRGEQFELSPAGTSAAGEPIIRVRIVPGKPTDETHVLGYSMHQVGSAWKAFDVTADSLDQPGRRVAG